MGSNTTMARIDRQAVERLADLNPDPMVVVTPDEGQLLYCNQSFIDLCGVRSRWIFRAMKDGAYAHQLLHFSDPTMLQDLFRRAAQLRQTTTTSSITCSTDIPKKHLVLNLIAIPIDEFENQAPAVIIQFKDTTAEHGVQAKYQKLLEAKRKHTEELENKVRERTNELSDAQDQLLQATRLAAIGEVASTAAHEVLNPLTAVSGNLESIHATLADGYDSLRELGKLVAEVKGQLENEAFLRLSQIVGDLSDDLTQNRRRIDIVRRASQRIERIVQGLSGMSRSSSELEVLDLAQVLKEARELMSYSFEQANVCLDSTIMPASPVEVYVDRGQLLQILTNLLHNAYQASKQVFPGSGGRVRMEVKLQTTTVEIHVEDNGVGIPKALQSHIFTQGFTTKPRGEGTGLGLSIARRLARNNGGDIDLARSESPGGTLMVITLPQRASAADVSETSSVDIPESLEVNI